MQCTNHPEASAAARCAGCAESFCTNCLVEIHGQHYCGACKVVTVKGRPAALSTIQEARLFPCSQASEALIYSCLGVICFIFALVGLAKASAANKLLAANPRLAGAEVNRAAIIIGWIFVGFWLLNCLISSMTRNAGGM